MDFFEGSSPPNFIPFCLDKYRSENDQTPDPGSTANLAHVLCSTADCGQSAFAPDFDPWTHVDVFSRSLTYKSLLLSYNVVKAGPKVGAVRVETSESSGVIGKSAVQIPSAFKRKRSGSSVVGSASSSLVEETAVFRSKN